MLGLQNEREWRAFCEFVLCDAALAHDARFSSNAQRHSHRDELYEVIVRAFAPLDASEVVARLERAQIANAHMNEMADVWDHPQLQARARFTEVGSPRGPITALLPPGASDRFSYRMDPIPALGEHTEAILSSLGYRADAIAALRASGVI
jgi:itaconate CoA-transferase